MKTLSLKTDISKLKIDPSDERLGIPSASAADRIIHCPGSWLMEKNQPQIARYAELSDRGTRIHAWLDGDTSVELNDEELREAQSMERGANKLWSQWIDSLPVDSTNTCVTTKEERGFIHCGVTPVTSGKWDERHQFDNHFLVVDFKSGGWDLPPVRHNLQLRTYALITLADHPEAESISVATIRPYDDEEEKMWLHTYTSADLHAAWFQWEQALDAAFSDSPVLVSGTHCQFCKAQFTCPARRAALTQVAASPAPTWSELSPVEKLSFYQKWKDAKRYGEAVEEAVKRDLKAGVFIPGLKLDAGREKNEINDVEAAKKRAMAHGLTAEQVGSCVSMSFAKVRDTLCVAKSWKKKDATPLAKQALAGLVETSRTEGSVVEL